MSEKGKGIIQIVSEKKKKDGSMAYAIFIDDVEYYDSKGAFKDKKGEEVEFEWAPSKDGNIKFINIPGEGRTSGGTSYRGKSPEELALQKNGFAMAYAKDQVSSLMAAFPHLITELPLIDGKPMKFLDFLTAVDIWATKTTLAKYEDIRSKL